MSVSPRHRLPAAPLGERVASFLIYCGRVDGPAALPLTRAIEDQSHSMRRAERQTNVGWREGEAPDQLCGRQVSMVWSLQQLPRDTLYNSEGTTRTQRCQNHWRGHSHPAFRRDAAMVWLQFAVATAERDVVFQRWAGLRPRLFTPRFLVCIASRTLPQDSHPQ